MQYVSMRNHNFMKQNLFTTDKGDNYKCTVCGAEGYRKTLGEIVTLTELESKRAAKCTFKSSLSNPLPKRVWVKKLPSFGIEEDIYDVVECPEAQKERFENDIWIYSEQRGEPVRLFDHEILCKEF